MQINIDLNSVMRDILILIGCCSIGALFGLCLRMSTIKDISEDVKRVERITKRKWCISCGNYTKPLFSFDGKCNLCGDKKKPEEECVNHTK